MTELLRVDQKVFELSSIKKIEIVNSSSVDTFFTKIYLASSEEAFEIFLVEGYLEALSMYRKLERLLGADKLVNLIK